MEDKEILKQKQTQGFLRGKISKRKHPRVDTTTIYKAIHYMNKDLHTQSYQHMISTSSYQFLIYPRASEPQRLLPIQGVSYTSRQHHPNQSSQASRMISCLAIRSFLLLAKSSCLVIRNTFLTKTSCSFHKASLTLQETSTLHKAMI